MARQRLIRNELPLVDEVVLVRALFDNSPNGAVFDRAALIADATLNFELFGYYGLSLWAASAGWAVDRVLAEKSRRAARVALFTVGDLRASGLRLAPSGKAPHYDAIIDPVDQAFGAVSLTTASAAQLADRLIRAAYTVVENRHHTADLY
jgi:hypothetical protein